MPPSRLGPCARNRGMDFSLSHSQLFSWRPLCPGRPCLVIIIIIPKLLVVVVVSSSSPLPTSQPAPPGPRAV